MTFGDRAAREWARSRQGVITLDEAVSCGLTERQVERRLLTGELEQLYRCVYRYAGAPATPLQRIRAATAAAGEGAVASHLTAAYLWGLLRDEPAEAHVTVPGACFRMRIPGVRFHRTRSFSADDLTVRHLIPTTSVARTVFDVGALLPAAVHESLTEDALRRDLLAIEALQATFDRLCGRGSRGAAAVRKFLAGHAAGARPESELEVRFLRVLRNAGLPRPAVQHEVRLGSRVYRIDAAYPELRLGLELDGFAWHAGRQSFDHDRVRANALLAAGWRILRFTWTDVTRRPAAVVADVTRARSASTPVPHPS